jgi:hypothetical protein
MQTLIMLIEINIRLEEWSVSELFISKNKSLIWLLQFCATFFMIEKNYDIYLESTDIEVSNSLLFKLLLESG